MEITLVVVADRAEERELEARFGAAAATIAASLLQDTVAVARAVDTARVEVYAEGAAQAFALAGLGPVHRVRAPGAASTRRTTAEILGMALEGGGPALLLSSGLPHLPAWRLRDAVTHLEHGADLVLGPADRGGWYLLGMRSPHSQLLSLVAASREPTNALVAAAQLSGQRLAILPPWFAVRTLEDLLELAELLRPMPTHVAASTRALGAAGFGRARALGG